MRTVRALWRLPSAKIIPASVGALFVSMNYERARRGHMSFQKYTPPFGWRHTQKDRLGGNVRDMHPSKRRRRCDPSSPSIVRSPIVAADIADGEGDGRKETNYVTGRSGRRPLRCAFDLHKIMLNFRENFRLPPARRSYKGASGTKG